MHAEGETSIDSLHEHMSGCEPSVLQTPCSVSRTYLGHQCCYSCYGDKVDMFVHAACPYYQAQHHDACASFVIAHGCAPRSVHRTKTRLETGVL